MNALQKLGIVVGSDKVAATIFESICSDFRQINYKRPSDYVRQVWNLYCGHKGRTNNVNGKVFEYVLATLFVRENILPYYLSAKVAFVPNIIYDLMFYTQEHGPICLSAKTSLRERYKQADLEAIALKYVHRKALSYLITLDEGEAAGVQRKIKTGDVIGLDAVIVATSDDFDRLLVQLKDFILSEPPTVKVIQSTQIVTREKVNSLGL